MNLMTTTDKVSMITSGTAAVDVISSYTDLLQGFAGSSGTQRAEPGVKGTAFSTATTGDIVVSPALSSTVRRVDEILIRNKSTGAANTITVQATLGGTVYEAFKTTLNPGETLVYKDGIGFYKPEVTVPSLGNESLSAQSGFAADTYLAGSSIAIPTGAPLAGTIYKLKLDVSKTSTGAAAPTFTVRYGSGGTVSDASRCAFAFGIGSTVADQGVVEIICVFRTVGTSTSAVIQGTAEMKHQLASTGLTTTGTAGYAAVFTTGGGFDSTPASSIIGCSYNGGASAVHTIQLVRAELIV
jgi:hypothetical protein